MNNTEQSGGPLVRKASVSASHLGIVRSITSPLGFFVLSLLIVESFLGAVITFAPLSEPTRVPFIWIGVALFIALVAAVYWLVLKHPTNLVFSESSHLQLEAMQLFGNNNTPLTEERLEALTPVKAPEPPIGQLPPAAEKS